MEKTEKVMEKVMENLGIFLLLKKYEPWLCAVTTKFCRFCRRDWSQKIQLVRFHGASRSHKIQLQKILSTHK